MPAEPRLPVDACALRCVLVIEDNELVAQLLRARLERRGIEAVLAPDAESGLLAAATQSVDVIVMDVCLPGMDGIEATRRLKAEPRTAHIPVVVATFLDDRQVAEALAEAGATVIWTKPVDIDRLMQLVSSLSGGKRP